MAAYTCSTCKKSVKLRVDLGSTAELHQNLRSGYGPSLVSTEEVRDMINYADRDRRLSAEVIRLRAQIIYIEVQQKLLKEHKIKLHSLLSPFRRIPNETLSRIFEYV
ncbi:hypothetical protein GYMLUDRAFT_62945 [Collybiopsis luxurians FD-317 M1]|uniref:F-box domain-containing protein n=1 Tax=Collybiopsis luxurians FD-317 M1 TaxID=944289 RepID=A0A0D0C9P9_9AGAR|nr:hypothetical protein GYMLUDRAFT_62945 [Collybiopsis luxurians FD-317 M1]